jgi:SAM-dependent methyltransferase
MNVRKPNYFQRLYRKLEIFIERSRDLDFSQVIPSADLGYDGALVIQCSPSGNKYLTNLLQDLLLVSSDNILDIGCGKGSAILRMTKFKFNNIDGIEIAKQNAEVARANFKKLSVDNVHIFNVDATEFNGYDNYNYFYMYNPFPDIVMQLVISKLLSQISEGKKITIIYNNPVCHKIIIGAGFRLLKIYPDQWGNGINVYSNGIYISGDIDCKLFRNEKGSRKIL